MVIKYLKCFDYGIKNWIYKMTLKTFELINELCMQFTHLAIYKELNSLSIYLNEWMNEWMDEWIDHLTFVFNT